jgi:hypothetical protein
MRTAAPLAALLALVAFPALAQAPAAPIAAKPAAATADADEDRLPKGAPKDDYEFVGWCTGILSGHMELFTRVKPELDEISKRWNTVEQDAKDYAEQHKAGVEIQALFARAMRAAEAASPRDIRPAGQAAANAGVGMWSAINTVDKKNQAYSWLNWELPPRCERVAQELEQRSKLNAALLRRPTGVTAGAVVAPPLPK